MKRILIALAVALAVFGGTNAQASSVLTMKRLTASSLAGGVIASGVCAVDFGSITAASNTNSNMCTAAGQPFACCTGVATGCSGAAITYTPGSANDTCVVQGVRPSDILLYSSEGPSNAGLAVRSITATQNTLTIRVDNVTSAAIDPAAFNVQFIVIRP